MRVAEILKQEEISSLNTFMEDMGIESDPVDQNIQRVSVTGEVFYNVNFIFKESTICGSTCFDK